ncbi:c-type cytochrome [Polymorphum gilvum]|uniref:Putative cytochrome c signal peptide protein n=1 Tax=Polymorphum gilvum (strain LMG 25793 / CGMCC 1.9160 / SL003B-26A1) TaxID=991905 RepID=F2IV66_POLGS|nr:cytochrome c [Polymorphum gilvum]ADZ71397.1 Putative cytochrome c signal peptide protein [Polymorphum gilvum SL003B-26A1]
MRKTIFAGAVLALSAPAVLAAGDPVAVRKATMQSVGAAAAVSGAMMKGELAYSPAVGKAAIATMNAAALSFGAFFPEGSDLDGDTTAAPKIWEDMAGFEATLAKFAEVTGAAAAAAGKDGPADLDAFKAAMGPVMASCKTCHETYRVQR